MTGLVSARWCLGDRDCATAVHEQGARLPVSEATILELHRLTRGEIGDAGRYSFRGLTAAASLKGHLQGDQRLEEF